MIHIHGSVHRTFDFPADIQTALAFYSDFRRILHYLPHISIVKEYDPNSYRMLFNTTELGIYRVNIYCDLFSEINEAERTLTIAPLNGCTTPVAAEAGIYSLVAHGNYSSTSTFHPQNGSTRIEYKLRIQSELPVPLGTQLVPQRIVESISNNITHRRMEEIARGFIERSLSAYQQSIASFGKT